MIVLDQMRDVYRLLTKTPYQESGPRPLTRMHIHTLAYQAILIAKGSAWKNAKLAAAKASLTAHRHVCASSQVKYNLQDMCVIIPDQTHSAINSGHYFHAI